MSRLRQTKISTPSNPPASTEEVYYATAGPGYNAPATLCSVDESGNIGVLATYGVTSYHFMKRTIYTTGASNHTPQNGCRMMLVQCVGAGGQGGGAATSSTQVSVGGGGGGGGWAQKAVTGSGIKITAYSVGAVGSAAGAGLTGVNGSDSTWDTTVVVGKGGAGGPVLAAGTTIVQQVGGAGGVAGTGDNTIAGSAGGTAMRFSTTQGFGGDGGSAAMIGVSGGAGSASPAGGVAGGAAAAASYGAGGGGAGTNSTAAAGGAGIGGIIIVDEFA